MASIIRIKRSTGFNKPGSLKTAEMAYAYGVGTATNDGDRLFIGTGDDGSGNATNVTIIGGSYFTDMLDHLPGLLRTNSAIIADSEKKVEELKSGNIHIDGFNDQILGLVAPTDSSGATTKKYVDSAITALDASINLSIQAAVQDSTGVVGGTYGGATSIPIIKVNDFGRVDSVGTSPLSTTLMVSADSGTADSVDLINDTLNFSGSTGIVTKVTDGNIDVRLDSTGISHSSSNFHSDGNRKYGTGSGLEIAVDDFGRISHVVNTTINAELRVRDDPNNAYKSLFLGGQNDLIVKGGNSINVNLTGPTHGGGGADYTPGTFEISVDSSSLSSIDSVSWGTEPMFPSQYPGTAMQGNDNIIITGTDGTQFSAQIRHFKDSQSFDGTVRTAIQPNTKLYVGGKLQFGNDYANGSYEYSGAGGITNMFRTQANSTFPEGFTLKENRNTYIEAENHFIQTVYRNYGFGHDSALTNNGNSSYNLYMGGHLVAKPLVSTYPLQDIGEDSSYTWNNAYFMGTVKAANLVLTSGGIAVDSGGAVAADSATFGTVRVDSVDRGKYIDSGTYGGANAIPVFTVNQAGLIDSISTVAVASQITVEDSDSTAVIDFASHNLKITSPNYPSFGGVPTLDIQLDSNEFTVAMPQVNSTGHTPGGAKTYVGSSTFLPRLAIDATGRVTDITTVQNLPQSKYLDTDYFAAQEFITNPLQTLTLQGEQGIVTKITNGSTSTASNTRFLFRLDSNISGLASLQVDNIKIDGNTISSTDSSNQIFIDPFPVGDSGDLVIRGNLIVQGTQTTVNSTEVSLNDKNLVLADSAANSSVADGAGITVGGAGYTGTKPQFVFDAATDRWDPNLPIDIPFVSLDSAVFLNGVALREVMEDHLDNFFGVDSNNAVTITYDDVANSMTWKSVDATKTQKGVSTFDSSNFAVVAGNVTVTVLDGGTY